MTALNLFGLCAVSIMVICYALEKRHALFTLAFAASCLLVSLYGGGPLHTRTQRQIR